MVKVTCALWNHTHALLTYNQTTAFYEHLDELEGVFRSYIIFLFIGSAISIIGLVSVITIWFIFPRIRNFQNYISLSQCIVATALPVVMCAAVCVKYGKVRDLTVMAHQVLGGVMKPADYEQKYKVFKKDYFFKWLSLAFVFVLMCLCCWTTAAAVLCYERVVKVFASDLSRKYLIVNSMCYGIPLLGVGLHELLYKLVKQRLIVIMLTTIVTSGIVNIAIYFSVVIAIFRGKRQGETKRAIMTSVLIFIFLGLSYTIAWMMLLYMSLKIFLSSKLWSYLIHPHPNQPVQEMVYEIRKSYALFYAQCVLVSVRGVMLCVFFACKKDARQLWNKQCFIKNEINYYTESF